MFRDEQRHGGAILDDDAGHLRNSLSTFLAEAEWRTAMRRREGAAEGGLGTVASLKRDGGERLLRPVERYRRPVQPEPRERRVQRLARRGVVEPVEVERGYARDLRESVQIQFLIEVLMEMGEHAGDPPAIRVPGSEASHGCRLAWTR